ncbi:MAG: PAS domain-containing sensor histidine kinase [Candidatus Binatia bacterium]
MAYATSETMNMAPDVDLARAVALEQRRVSGDRLPFFALGWLGATLLFVAVLAWESPASRTMGLWLGVGQTALVVASLGLVRRDPEAAIVQPIVLLTCVGLGLSSTAFHMHLGGREPVIAMMLFALSVIASLLFVWRWHFALGLFAGTFGPWLVTGPWAGLQLTPLQMAAGAVVGVLICVTMAEGSFRSFRTAFVHRQRELERTAELQMSRDAYRDLAENATDLIWTADLDWRFTYVNEAGACYLGKPAATLVGVPLRTVMTKHPTNTAEWERISAAGANLTAYTVQVRPGATHGEPRWFDVVTSVVRDSQDRVIGIRGISRDVTERRRIEEALRASEEKLRELAHGQVRVREEERKRLGLDLHDDVCQEVAGIGILVEAVRTRLGSDAPGSADLARAVRYLSELVEHLRSLAGELRPLQLHDLGLEGSLRSLVAGLVATETQITLALPAALPRLDEETEIAVYRVAQEALSNATRHGDARWIQVTVSVSDARLHLEVRDDGCGFDPARTRPGALGLVGMEERALAIRGSLTVDSAPGVGTTLRFECPLAQPMPANAA